MSRSRARATHASWRRGLRSQAEAGTLRCSRTAECGDFVGTRCGFGLSATCERVTCTTDLDCLTVAGPGAGTVPCDRSTGTCADFARVPVVARQFGGGLTLLPFRDGPSEPRLHVLATSVRRGDGRSGVTFSNLVPDLGGSAIAFDSFRASRQVRLGNDHLFTSGFAATLYEHLELGTVLVLIGVDRAGAMHLSWRRSD